MANIKARQKLSALYDKGVEVRFGPGPNGEPVEKIAPGGKGYFKDEDGKREPLPEGWVAVWVQPPNPLQREMAMRDSQAARAKSLVRAKRDENSEEHLTVMAFLADMSDETLVEYVILNDNDTRQGDAIREVLADDEWENMTELQDALRVFHERVEEGSLTIEERDADPDWIALAEKDAEFGDQVQRRIEELMNAQRDVLKMQVDTNRATVERKALQRRAEQVGTQAFAYEYELQMHFYSVREIDDHGALVYSNPREFASEAEEIREVIGEANRGFITDGAEAKNLLGVVSGSESSEPPSEPETSEASTQEGANA